MIALYSAAPQQQKPASAGGFASDPFGSAPFGQPNNNTFASQPTNNNNMFFGAQPQQQPAFGQQSFGSFAQPQPAFQPFQMQPTPASSTPAATTAAVAAAAPSDTEKGLLADKTLASAKHLWDLVFLLKMTFSFFYLFKKRNVIGFSWQTSRYGYCWSKETCSSNGCTLSLFVLLSLFL